MYTFLEFDTLIKYFYTKTLIMEQMERIINREDLNSYVSLNMSIVGHTRLTHKH